MGHIDPTKEIFAQFRDNDRPGPILEDAGPAG